MSSVLVSYRSEHNAGHSVASFLLKTFEILEKAQFSHIVSWAFDDDTFAIKNIMQFTNEVLPKYFRHRNFSSFVRQLNMYDFHKIKQSNDYIVFRNPLFRKGQSHLLKKIRRKAPKKNQLEKKISSTIGTSRLEENSHIKYCLEGSLHDSANAFDKSVTAFEVMYTALHKKEKNELISSTFPQGDGKPLLSSMMDKLYQTFKVASVCLKSADIIANSTDDALRQKYSKYAQLKLGLKQIRKIKKQREESSDKSYGVKSECSIGDKKERY